jgi:asparagine synthase (glutamine-hydrolysing)
LQRTPNAGITAMEQTAMHMHRAIRHRGPDDEGTWADAEAGVAIGHRRLSIVDLSAAGHQPMVSHSGRFVVAFNGEIYNHQDLRRLLDQEGVSPTWRGYSDTETFLACIEAWGIERTLDAIVGMFGIALWDRELRRLTLMRDRMGEKPVYYGWQAGTFLFGSEVRALRAHPAFAAEIDRGALALLLRHNMIPGPYSIYQGIFKLPAGTFLHVTSGSTDASPVAYWSLAEVAQRGAADPFTGSEEEAIQELERRLSAAVRGQMIADVPLGALLSGGVDSSTVVALMQANSSRPVRTFTIGFHEREYDEADAAQAIARHLGTEHTELTLAGSDAQALVPEIAGIYDEPFADSSQLPTHLVMRLARKHVTVALSGDAGDELFAGYNRYVHAPRVWSVMGNVPFPVRRMVGRGLQFLSVESINRVAGPVARRVGVSIPGDKAHKLGRKLRHVRDLDDLCVSMVSEWPDATSAVRDGAFPPNLMDDRSRWPRLADPVARMMVLDGLFYLPDDILVKVDRAAMAVALETRVPFLDRDVVEFAARLPMRMKIHAGRGKWLVRKLLDKYVPTQLIDRPKMGFSIPVDAWLRGPLRPWAEDLLNTDRLKREGFFAPEEIRALWRAHLSGVASNGHRLWSVLMFQSWMEKNS